jgi:hypothetical protein
MMAIADLSGTYKLGGLAHFPDRRFDTLGLSLANPRAAALRETTGAISASMASPIKCCGASAADRPQSVHSPVSWERLTIVI